MGTISIRFGIDPNCVRRLYTEADEWLVVRRIYENGIYMDKMGGDCQRIRSRPRLEKAIRAACKGVWSRGGASYIEVQPWREDGIYPVPMPVREFLASFPGAIEKQEGQGQVINLMHEIAHLEASCPGTD